MKITGDDFISLLYLSEKDDAIIEMRKALNAPRPLIDKKFKEKGHTSMVLEDSRVELFFSDVSKFDIKNSTLNKDDIIFSKIDYSFKSNLILPFGLTMGDSYDSVIKKIKRKEDKDNSMFSQKVWKFQRPDGKFYLIYTYFEKDYSELLKLSIATYDNNKKYVKI